MGPYTNPTRAIKVSDRIKVACQKCGYSWQRRIIDLKTNGCKRCYHNTISQRCITPYKDVVKKIRDIHKYTFLLFEDGYKGMNEISFIRHNVCGNIFYKTPNQLIKSRTTSNCPYCPGGEKHMYQKTLAPGNPDQGRINLTKIIENRTAGRFTLATHSPRFLLKCNRCDSSDTYRAELSTIFNGRECCKKCRTNKPSEPRAFKLDEAMELLSRRGLRTSKIGKPIKSYSEKTNFYRTDTGRLRYKNKSIFEICNDSASRKSFRKTQKSNHRNPWTPKDHLQIEHMCNEGYKNSEIGEHLGRSRSSIDGQIFLLKKRGIDGVFQGSCRV